MECKNCHTDKPEQYFFKNKSAKNGYDSSCKKCRYIKNVEWRKNNIEKSRILNRKSQDKRRVELRIAAIQAYGGKCECCGESEILFLTLEHINGVPKIDRMANGKRKRTVDILRRLEREGWPKTDHTILCFNCNCSKGIYGSCPHKGVIR